MYTLPFGLAFLTCACFGHGSHSPLESLALLLRAFTAPVPELLDVRRNKNLATQRFFARHETFVRGRRIRACRAVFMNAKSSTSLDELLSGPVPKLIDTLCSTGSSLKLTPKTAARCIDAVCSYAAVEDLGNANVANEIALQTDLERTYVALTKRGLLRGFGSCADALLPLPATLSPSGQEKVTGLPTSAFAPNAGNGFMDSLAGAASAAVLLFASRFWDFDPRSALSVILAAVLADRVVLRGSFFEAIISALRPAYRETKLKHEAGHLLVAYLLGNPIQACLLDAWTALKDGRFNAVQAGTVFYDPELGQGMMSGKVTRTCIDRYSIVVMAGIAAEAMANGAAEGGAADEKALIELLSSLDAGRSWDKTRIQSQALWGSAQAFLLLREHAPAYIALCKALEEGASIGEAVIAIEEALPPKLPSQGRKRTGIDAGTRLAEIEKRLSDLDSELNPKRRFLM